MHVSGFVLGWRVEVVVVLGVGLLVIVGFGVARRLVLWGAQFVTTSGVLLVHVPIKTVFIIMWLSIQVAILLLPDSKISQLTSFMFRPHL